MPTLDELDLMRCPRCGRLFGKEPGKTHCLQCSGGAEEGPSTAAKKKFAITQSALYFGMPLDVVREAAGDATDADPKPAASHSCVRCGERDSVEGSDFCINCSLDLHQEFGQAALELFSTVGSGEVRAANMSLLATVEDKRARTATSRINPVGTPRIKY